KRCQSLENSATGSTGNTGANSQHYTSLCSPCSPWLLLPRAPRGCYSCVRAPVSDTLAFFGAQRMSKITVGILGLGTVGTGVVRLLADDPRFKIKWVAVRDTSKPRDLDLSAIRMTDRPDDLVDDPEVEIVIEVAGGIDRIYELIKRAVARGKHVVTANKELIARHGAEIFNLAHRNN